MNLTYNDIAPRKEKNKKNNIKYIKRNLIRKKFKM